ncbi:MAG: hypothetical protein ACK5D5_02815 [Bacteroidota bacterium]|jgi:hypothetical protein
MKFKIIIICFTFCFLLGFEFSCFAQRIVSRSGCVEMYSNTYVTSNGATYSSWIRNTCSKPLFIKKSEYKAVFKKTNSKGNSVIFGTNRKIKFPEIFIAGQTEIYGSGKGSDNNRSGVTYDDVRSESGDIGGAYEISSETPSGFNSNMELTLNEEKYLGEHNGIKFYVTLLTYDKFFDKDWDSFHKYKLDFKFENTKSVKDKTTYKVLSEVSFNGVNFSVEKTISKLKRNEKYVKSHEFDFFSNIKDKVYIRQLPESNVPQLKN